MKFKARFIPNILSGIRLILVGVFVAVFTVDYPRGLNAAMVIFVIAGLTDVADGALARRFGWESNLGRLLDPLADKLMQCAALICLAVKSVLPLWFVIPYMLKEAVMLCGGMFMLKKKEIVVTSKWYGKAVCVLFYIVVAVVMLSGSEITVNRAGINLLCALMLILTVIALITYFVRYFINGQQNSVAGQILKGNNKQNE